MYIIASDIARKYNIDNGSTSRGTYLNVAPTTRQHMYSVYQYTILQNYYGTATVTTSKVTSNAVRTCGAEISCKSTDTGLVCRVECLFSYQFILLGK